MCIISFGVVDAFCFSHDMIDDQRFAHYCSRHCQTLFAFFLGAHACFSATPFFFSDSVVRAYIGRLPHLLDLVPLLRSGQSRRLMGYCSCTRPLTRRSEYDISLGYSNNYTLFPFERVSRFSTVVRRRYRKRSPFHFAATGFLQKSPFFPMHSEQEIILIPLELKCSSQ